MKRYEFDTKLIYEVSEDGLKISTQLVNTDYTFCEKVIPIELSDEDLINMLKKKGYKIIKEY